MTRGEGERFCPPAGDQQPSCSRKDEAQRIAANVAKGDRNANEEI